MTCSVVLQNFHGSYSPGDTILGHLLCTFTSTENILGVRVKLTGKEHTEWIERESFYDSHVKKTRYRDVVYNGDNEFLAEEVTLIGEKTMTPDHYEYPFLFTLPRNLPTTDFNGSHGYIKYFIKGTVDMPFVSDYEDEIYFDVPSPIDFNYLRPELQMEPCTYQEEKTVGCFYCVSGPITLDVHLQKEAFILGEVAKVKIDVSNSSNEYIDEVNLKLKTVTELKATSPNTSHKCDTELWASNSVSGVAAHGQRTYELNFNIPPSAKIYNFSQCTLFKQWSVLRVEAVLTGCNNNMDVEASVVIGHIALQNGSQNQSLQEVSFTSSSIPEGPPEVVIVPVSPPPPYPAKGNAAPYPTGPPKFPVPPPGQIGFSLPSSSGTRYSPGQGSSSAAANAPPAEFAPSAPTIDPSCGLPEHPPPSYNDVINASGGEGLYPPARHNGSAATLPNLNAIELLKQFQSLLTGTVIEDNSQINCAIEVSPGLSNILLKIVDS